MPPHALLPLGTLAPLGMSIGLALTISACGEPAASALSATTFPSDVTTPRRSSNIETAQRVSATFRLLDGSFQFTLRDNGNISTIAGAYTGEAQATSGKTTASLNLTVRRATGVALGLTGLGLAVDGSGAGYLGEGEFVFALKLQLPTRNGAGAIPLKVQGTAAISCSPQHRIVVTLHGTGSSPQLGDVEVKLEHEVENTFCSS